MSHGILPPSRVSETQNRNQNGSQNHAFESSIQIQIQSELITQKVRTTPRTSWPTRPNQGKKPISGIRILDIIRIIGGPSSAKIHSVLGADVHQISSCTIPEATILTFDTQLGKRDIGIELKSVEGRLVFRGLFEVRIYCWMGIEPVL